MSKGETKKRGRTWWVNYDNQGESEPSIDGTPYIWGSYAEAKNVALPNYRNVEVRLVEVRKKKSTKPGGKNGK